MRSSTHLAFGLFLYLVMIRGFDIVMLILFLFFSILPDIDLHSSYISKHVKYLSYFFEVVLKHRGFIHSLWFVALLWVLLGEYRLAVIGYLGHLFLDILNKKGLCLFWPFVKVKGFCNSGKLFDKLLFYGLLSADIWLIYSLL